MNKTILITGGAGFIGSHAVKYFLKKYPHYKVLNLDLLTYAGNLENLNNLENLHNYKFIHGDICNPELVEELFSRYSISTVINFAAESHVDRSIKDPFQFAKTNILGTLNLLNNFKSKWEGNWKDCLFYHVSTDEVYGSLGETGLFTENTPYRPNSPYSASKASSDHFVRAFGETFNLPYIISNCSNNYGPNQYPEKLIPVVILKILTSQPIPVYGNGLFTRDWLHVYDHISAIDTILHKGKKFETYNIGASNEWKNIELIEQICEIADRKLERKETSKSLITYVQDRPGHDLRYAIDSNKLIQELNWRPSVKMEDGLSETLDWYIDKFNANNNLN